jgi:hypothetical protein
MAEQDDLEALVGPDEETEDDDDPGWEGVQNLLAQARVSVRSGQFKQALETLTMAESWLDWRPPDAREDVPMYQVLYSRLQTLLLLLRERREQRTLERKRARPRKPKG